MFYGIGASVRERKKICLLWFEFFVGHIVTHNQDEWDRQKGQNGPNFSFLLVKTGESKRDRNKDVQAYPVHFITFKSLQL